MESFVVKGRQGALSAAGIKAYRQCGLLIAEHFFNPQETETLTSAVKAAAHRRGRDIFPGIDPQLAGEMRFDGQLKPKPSVDWDNINRQADIPANVRAASERADAGKAVTYRHRKVELKFKNQKQVDRAYRRLAKRREQYENYKGAPRLLTEEEEMSGARVSRSRLQKAGEEYTESQMMADLEKYKKSGQLELDLRRENHINDTFAFIGAWSRCWSYLMTSDDALRELVLRDGGVGPRVGEAAAALSGEVVVRAFADSAYESYSFMNATPLFFAGVGSDYKSDTALGVMVGLTDSTGRDHADAQRLTVLPGSHHVTLRLSNHGTDTSRFQMSSVFDYGKMVRLTPELQGLTPVVLPPLRPGSVLFLHNFTLAGTLPTLTGAALSPYQAPAGRTVSNPYQYSLAVMPDRCAFTGERNSWASRDSHGPLHTYEKGQLLVDDTKFPVLHRALDIE